jgi:hypothetical protein
MTKRRLLPRAVLAALLLVLPAAADAPRDQYERFDGDSLTIRDAFTKLEWDRRGVLASVAYVTAEGGCPLAATLGGVGRLPTIKELLTVFDEEPHVEYEFGKLVSKQIDAVAFGDTPVDLPYWSGTPAGPGKVWALSFATGEMVSLATDGSAKAHARCVR